MVRRLRVLAVRIVAKKNTNVYKNQKRFFLYKIVLK